MPSGAGSGRRCGRPRWAFPQGDPARADSVFFGGAEDAERLFDKGRAHEILDGTGRIRFTTWRELSLSVAGDDHRPELAALQVPTLFIYGAADSPYTGQPVADELCGVVPHCTKAGFSKSGHWPFLEEPARFRQVLERVSDPVVQGRQRLSRSACRRPSAS